MYLDSLKIIKEYRGLPVDLEINLQDITLLVGEQGCGKSSLLKLLQENNKEYLDINISDEHKGKTIKSYYFDSEKQNPRVAPDHNFYDYQGRSVGIGIGGKINSMFQSHGEVLKEYTVNRIPQAENCVLLLDEPESALTVRNQYKLVNSVIDCARNNKCQLIIATHCLPLIESINYVYDLNEKKWKQSETFISEEKKNI